MRRAGTATAAGSCPTTSGTLLRPCNGGRRVRRGSEERRVNRSGTSNRYGSRGPIQGWCGRRSQHADRRARRDKSVSLGRRAARRSSSGAWTNPPLSARHLAWVAGRTFGTRRKAGPIHGKCHRCCNISRQPQARRGRSLIAGCPGNLFISGWRPVRDGAGVACKAVSGVHPLC
jgi:hypothetical protein